MRIKLAYPIRLSSLFGKKSTKEDHIIRYVCTDSRLLKPGDLFIALKGERHNGADFTKYAMDIGAIAVSESSSSNIKIDNTEEFLLNFINIYKRRLKSIKKTVAITGSVGKTSTKTVLSTLLESKYKVHATKGNQNNLLGTLYTVLSTPRNAEILVLEFGMNHLGEISLLSKATRPDISIITNVGTAHIGNLGGREKIAKAKSEIVDGMKTHTVIIPQAEPLLENIKGKITISFKEGTNADITLIQRQKTNESGYILTHGEKTCEFNVKSHDKRLIYAIGFSLSVCSIMGIDIKELGKTIEKVNEWGFRQRFIEKNGYKIYDDTYSASYEAVLCVVDMLTAKFGRISCVLGDILELGKFSSEIHIRLGKELSRRKIDNLYLFGTDSEKIAEGISATGNKSIKIYINKDKNHPEITARQIKDSITGGVLLFKGSKKMHTEKIIDLL